MTRLEQQQRPAAVSAAMGDYAASFAWDFITTLTNDDLDLSGRRCRRPTTEFGLRAEVARFVRRMQKMAPEVAYLIAYQGLDTGHGHAHALLGNCSALSPWRVRRAWKAGISDVQRYDSTQAGA